MAGSSFLMKATVRIARPADFGRIVAAYSAWGYSGGMTLVDTAWLAEADDELIGVVRVSPENGTLVLRGMRIAEDWRRRGIGTRMLRELAAWLGHRECYCIPYDHLVGFYGQIGFAEIATGAVPAFLAARLADYRKRRGLRVSIMVRGAA